MTTSSVTRMILDNQHILTILPCTCFQRAGIVYVCPHHWRTAKLNKEVTHGSTDHHLQPEGGSAAGSADDGLSPPPK
ncbi:MAG: hypothetical protein H6658_01960 [Ardenticatenaceae bacterium]|nr:hypothetical protein [Ardenticatenaceae bacterium]